MHALNKITCNPLKLQMASNIMLMDTKKKDHQHENLTS